jgi:RNA polymerase sigma factor (sigma-70 family)
VTEIDRHFEAAREGDRRAFADWAKRVERPLRLCLRRFAQAVDVEGVIQETLMRMWLLATTARKRELAGENASLRFAVGMARNIARAEARRTGREKVLPPEDMPDSEVPPDPPADPGLARAIAECLEQVAKRPLEALMARLREQHRLADRRIAETLGMTVNAFHQNIVRARRQLAECLRGKGVPLEEILQ